MSYASDSDLTARHPEAAAVDATLRGYALADAALVMDDEVFPASVRAHCLLTMHFLALNPSSGISSSAGPVTSRRAGEIAVTYGSSAASSEGPHSETEYGRAYDAERRRAFVVGIAI